jgi:7,8-dihydropterin-6-yl-methyl-4-(beta-D-ribofuranosyl)aminobenzene 5'-phosphate synthase
LLSASGAEFIFTYAPTQISPNIWVSGTIPRVTDFERESLNFFDASKQTDRFPDEIAFYVLTPEGLVVITGCSHRGLVNTVKQGQKVTGAAKIRAIIGGGHLSAAEDWQKDATLDFLRELSPDVTALNHCTGIDVQGYLHTVPEVHFVAANAGDVLEI